MTTRRLSAPLKAAVSSVTHGRLLRPIVAVMVALVAAPAATPSVLHAQGLISAGVGVGGGIGDRKKDDSGSGAHGAAYVQLHVPVFPVALRADALFAKTANSGTGLALMGDAVYLAPVPVVSPYVLAGYGRYGIGKDSAQTGWNAGVGVRVRTPVVAFYVEGRRHQRIGRDLLTIGISR